MNKIQIKDNIVVINENEVSDITKLRDELEKLRNDDVDILNDLEDNFELLVNIDDDLQFLDKLLFDEYRCNVHVNGKPVNDRLINNITYYNVGNSKKEKSMESLLTVGNGYFSMRGNVSFSKNNEDHYGASYVAGLYNSAITNINSRDVSNEDFVSIGNLNEYELYLDDNLVDVLKCEELKVKRNLDLNTATFSEVFEFIYNNEVVTITTSRFISMSNMNYGQVKINVEAPFKIKLKAIYNLNIKNEGVERYASLTNTHLDINDVAINNDCYKVILRTKDSKIDTYIKISSENTIYNNNVIESIYEGSNNLEVTRHITVSNNSEDIKVSSNIYEEHKDSYNLLLEENDILIEGDDYLYKMIKINRYHLLCSLSKHNINLDVSITARGLHGEAYRGHIFWDEIFIMPYYLTFDPEIVKACLLYRYNRLGAAKDNAKLLNYEGAVYPWQSGLYGDEQTQTTHLNPISGNWDPDYSSFQRHVGLAIAYNVIKYYEATNDTKFMKDYGFEMISSICEFFLNKCELIDNKYSIKNVMGPNEFHEESINSPGGGLKDNAYTNFFVSYLFNKIVAYDLDFDNDMLLEISRNLKFNINDNIIEQFDGFFDLEQLDFDYYKNKYGNIYRMDRILKSEGKDPSDYQVCKQADLLMIFYLFSKEEVTNTFKNLGIEVTDKMIKDNIEYYLKRTTHGSTLSRIVHSSIIRSYTDEQVNSYEMYKVACGSDYYDIQGGTTAEGIHTGVMGASNYELFKSFANIDYNKDEINGFANLSGSITRLKFNTLFKNEKYEVNVTKNNVDFLKIT